MILIYKRIFIKIITLCMIIFSLLSVALSTAYAEEVDESNTDQENAIIENLSGTDPVKKMEDQLNKYSEQGIKEIIPEFDPQKIMGDAAKGKFEFSFTGLVNSLLSFLFKEIYVNIGLLIKLVVIVVFCAILRNLQSSFLSESVGEIAFYACYIVIVAIMMISLDTVLSMGREIIDNLVNFMHATIPVLITLLISGGNLTSAGVFQPILIMIVEFSATIIKNVFMPLITLSIIVSIVDNISDKIQISRLAQFFKQISLWGLGLMLTIFVGILAVQGSLGAVVDGITSKTAKFAIGAFIPVAGKYLADAADAVIGCTLLIKNAAGIAAMIGILGICIVPLLKIFALIALYRITCILVEPIADKRITNCISDMATALTFILGIAASVALMFLISITAIIGASNISSMMR